MRIAYLVRAHKNPRQLARLVGALRHPEVSFYIHIDGKVDEEPFRAALAQDGSLQDLVFVRPRVNVYWGGFSMVEATLNGLRALVQHCGPQAPDYVCLMTGQDYPIKSNQQIAAYFGQHHGREFISYARMPTPFWGEKEMVRLDIYHFNDWPLVTWPLTRKQAVLDLKDKALRAAGRVIKPLLPKRRLPQGLIPYAGTAWWCLSYACAKYILDYLDQNPAVVKFYKRTLHAEEGLFQTLVMHSQFAERVMEEPLEKRLEHNLWHADWAGTHPAVIRANDFPALLGSQSLFARKFDTNIDNEILDLLDQHRADC